MKEMIFRTSDDGIVMNNASEIELVRCKDCKYLNAPANGAPFCKRIKKFVDADWFCAEGEKSS